jgi:carbon storage regulator CsrA
MLVLSRRLHEKIVFPGFAAKVEIVSIKPGVVRLGIEAPRDVAVLREELPDRHKEWSEPAAPTQPDDILSRVEQLLRKRLQVSAIGLALLRRQIREGRTQEAETTLGEIEDDLRLLQDRVGAELNQPVTSESGQGARESSLPRSGRSSSRLPRPGSANCALDRSPAAPEWRVGRLRPCHSKR